MLLGPRPVLVRIRLGSSEDGKSGQDLTLFAAARQVDVPLIKESWFPTPDHASENESQPLLGLSWHNNRHTHGGKCYIRRCLCSRCNHNLSEWGSSPLEFFSPEIGASLLRRRCRRPGESSGPQARGSSMHKGGCAFGQRFRPARGAVSFGLPSWDR